MATCKYAIYQIRYFPDGDLKDSWGEFGGLVAQFSHLANVRRLSITDRAGIAATYDRRVRQMLQTAALGRSGNADYFDLLTEINTDIRAAAIRDSDVRGEAIKKAGGKSKNEADKEGAKIEGME